MGEGKIAFIKIGHLSHCNEKILDQLRINFQNQPFEVIDLWENLVNPGDRMCRLASYLEYGQEIFSGRKTANDCLMRTTYFFRLVKKNLHQLYGKDHFLFTFQTQSLFDASFPGTPHFVYTDHTHLANRFYPDFNESSLYSKQWVALEKTIYQNAALVFTMSGNISRSLVEQYACSPEKIKLVYCGGNVEIPVDATVNLNKYSSQNILFVGFEWQRKGGPQLVEAFKLVLEACPDARLTIIGHPPEINLPNCHLVGEVPLAELSSYYNQAAVFCVPTRREPFGFSFLEAFSYRLPVVATTVGALPEVVTNGVNGYLVNPDDTRQLADRLIEMIRDPEKCQTFGKNGYYAVRDKLNWGNTVRLISEAIKMKLAETSPLTPG